MCARDFDELLSEKLSRAKFTVQFQQHVSASLVHLQLPLHLARKAMVFGERYTHQDECGSD
jgi:hypothetical protein